MKSPTILVLLSLGFAVPLACGQAKQPAQITFRVVDDLGQPVSGGTVSASTFSHVVRSEGFGHQVNDIYTVEIGPKGAAILKGDSLNGEFTYAVEPTRQYYPGAGGKYRFTSSESGRWEPSNPEVTVVVPRILNPVPLYVRQLGIMQNVEMPTTGPVGFDLLVSDWVAPHGKGKRADLIFGRKAITPVTDPAKAFESIFTISFANEGDGIQSRPAAPTRRLIELPREAPESGYEPTLVKKVARAAEGAALENDTREDQNYFFRVRTALDPNGKIISALYGKIYGDIQFFATASPNGMVRFLYYLNPTSLDRNLEFDYKRNLFKEPMDGILGHGP